MRMDSRPFCYVTAVLSFVFICVALGNPLNGQAPSSGRPHPFEDSPLGQFSPAKSLPPQSFHHGMVASTAGPMITQQIDLSQTLSKYAEIRNCSLDKAFAETVTYLKMVPIHDFPQSTNQMVGKQAIYKIVEKDIYQITGSQTFFDSLPLHLLCLENGKRHITIESRFIAINPSEIESLQEFMIPKTFVAFTNKIPQAKPTATEATYASSKALRQQNSDAGTFVIATETKTKVHPSFMGRLNKDGLKRLLAKVNDMEGAEYTRPPNITVLPGQIATIADTSTKPVVVGLERIASDHATAHQPIVQSLENGSVMQLRANGENGSIRLDGDLAFGEVTNVKTFQYPKIISEKGNPLFVAEPEFTLKEVHWSVAVKVGETILLDPVFTKEINDPTPKKGDGPTHGRVVVLITPRFVDIEPKIRINEPKIRGNESKIPR